MKKSVKSSSHTISSVNRTQLKSDTDSSKENVMLKKSIKKRPAVQMTILQKTEMEHLVTKNLGVAQAKTSLRRAALKTDTTKSLNAAPGLVKRPKQKPPQSENRSTNPNQIEKLQPTFRPNKVMGAIQNVTSPKDSSIIPSPEKSIRPSSNERKRTTTRTLRPEEIIILKTQYNNSFGPKLSGDGLLKDTIASENSSDSLKVFGERSGVFEILDNENEKEAKYHSDVSEKGAENGKYDKERKYLTNNTKIETNGENSGHQIGDDTNSSSLHEREAGEKLSPREQTTKSASTNAEVNYEDDFESYESDFENFSSLSTKTENSNCSSIDGINLLESEKSNEMLCDIQQPTSAIDECSQKKLEHLSCFETESCSPSAQQDQYGKDITTVSTKYLSINYDQQDTSQKRSNIKSKTTRTPYKFSKRGRELMSKIKLDEITFNLFALTPVKYENFMKLYGLQNCSQAAIQTKNDYTECSLQTEETGVRSAWTQEPPQVSLQLLPEGDLGEVERASKHFNFNGKSIVKSSNHFAKYLSPQPKFNTVDFSDLNEFLYRTELIATSLLSRSTIRHILRNSSDSIAAAYCILNSRILNATKVMKVICNSKSNLVVLVHEDLDSVYREEFRSLLSVWTVDDPRRPIKILSTWSKVCKAEICSDLQDVIIAGLEDGSIALWDLKESYNFGVKFGDGSYFFPPTQTIAPCYEKNDFVSTDLGFIVDVKAFKSHPHLWRLNSYRPVQFVSLNDSGILAIWTLVRLGDTDWKPIHYTKNDSSKLEYNSPSARFKLIQNSICNLHEFLQQKLTRIGFEKTRTYFEGETFGDSTLKELKYTRCKDGSNHTGIRFTCLDVGVDTIYISTNRNFVLSCTKSLKREKVQKVFFKNRKGYFATALKLVCNDSYLIVGFSNGSVTMFSCSPNKYQCNNEQSQIDVATCTNPSAVQQLTTESDVGKSCTIQNLVKNEKSRYMRKSINCATDSRQTIASTNLKTNKSKGKYFGNQVLLAGSVLRKDIISSLEITNNEEKLLVLVNRNLRIFDFTKKVEQAGFVSDSIISIGLTKETLGRQNLVLLTKDDNVEVHVIK